MKRLLKRSLLVWPVPIVLAGCLLLSMVSPLLVRATSAAEAASTFSFSPVADARVEAAFPNTNFGASIELRTSSFPVQTSYLRFVVAGLGAGTLQSATLRIYAAVSSRVGYQVRSIPTYTWGETTVTYNNRPTANGLLGDSGAHGSDVYTAVDVTDYVKGNGTYDLALTSSVAEVVTYDSREARHPPELVLLFVPAHSTPTGSPAATSSPAATATHIGTSTPTPASNGTSTPTPLPLQTPTGTVTPVACARSFPFGVFNLPQSLFGQPYDGTALKVSTNPRAANYILTVLSRARANHTRLLVIMAGNRFSYQNPDGSFSLALFTNQIAAFASFDLSSYIADGTVLGITIMDEPQDVVGNWNGHPVLDADIDAAAAFIEAQHPGVRAIVGSHFDYLLARNYPWKYLSGAIDPFTVRNSQNALSGHYPDPMAYMDSEVALAKAHGFVMFTDLNGPNGGANGGPMTAAQFLSWGTHAINLPYSSGTFVWTWSSAGWLNGSYFTQASLAPIVSQLAQLAANRSSCPS